jgi:ceramide kinase
MNVFASGENQPLDISSIQSGSELLRYSVSFAGYGFFGDVVKDSEKLRWAGVKRYDISGAKIFLANRYNCTAVFLDFVRHIS